MTDTELLQRFVRERDGEAFARLAERYGPMVRAAALRVTGQSSLAEEAAQTAFLLLAEKAERRAIAHPGPWLHRAAVLCSRNVLRRERRESAKRRAYATSLINTAPDDRRFEWEEIRPLLDEAIGKLPRRDQEAVVLRYFEGRSLAETGAALGLTAEAVRMRLGRALERLSGVLRRRGAALSIAALTSGLLTEGARAESLPSGWSAVVSRTAAVPPRPLRRAWRSPLAPAAVFVCGWGLTAVVLHAVSSPAGDPPSRLAPSAPVANRRPPGPAASAWRLKRLGMDIASLMPDHNSAVLLADILTRLYALNPGEMAQLVESLPQLASGRHTHFIASQFFEHWAFIDPPAADAALRSLTTSPSHWTEVQGLFRGWMRRDREQAMARALQPDNSGRRFETAFRILADFDLPDACGRMLQQIENGHPERFVGAQAIANAADAASDPHFFDFLAAIRDPDLYWTALRTASGDAFEQVGALHSHHRLLREHPEKTIAAIRQVADAKKRGRAMDVLMTAVAWEYGRHDPARGAALLTEMGADTASTYWGWQTLALTWESTDAGGFSRWFSELPAGPVRSAVEARPRQNGSSTVVHPPIVLE